MPWEEKLKIYSHQVNWVDGQPQPQKAEGINVDIPVSEPLKIECQHFIDSIKNDTQPRTDGAEGLRVLRVLDAAQKSLHLKKNVDLNIKPPAYYAHETAIIDRDATIGNATKIWHFSHILKDVKIGDNCIIGQNVMVGPDAVIGNGCKIQNNVSIYKGVTLEADVFCGPSCVFTNVNTPRANVERKDEFDITHVETGVTIGANATFGCGNRLGAYSLIGAGAVVTKDVKPHALMVGIPAKQIGWVSHAGEKLNENLVCPREGRSYQIKNDTLFELSPLKKAQ